MSTLTLPTEPTTHFALAEDNTATAPPEQRGLRRDGVRLLVIAERWAYNRSFPIMAWSALVELAEETCAGLLDEMSAEYADRPAADLVEEARAVLDRVAPAVTSSG